ncbi:MAG: hypothetical protein ABEJ42_00090 [Halobacteriaceae archaeon]
MATENARAGGTVVCRACSRAAERIDGYWWCVTSACDHHRTVHGPLRPSEWRVADES